MKALCTFLTLASRETAGAATSIVTVESPSTTAGSLIVVAVRCNSTSVTVTSVTDTASNTYTLIASASSSVTTIELWYAWNITANAANFVTANFSGSVGSRVILAVEFEGVLASGDPLDTSATGTANGTSATTGAFTTATAEQLIIGASQHESASGSWNGYDPDHLGIFATGSAATQTVAMGFKIVTAIQTGVTLKMADPAAVPRQIIAATFKLADATGGGGGGGSYAFA